MNTIRIHQLTKSYANGVKALNNISMEISNGMFGLLGPNGAGKSTLMRTIAGLQPPDSGTITFNDTDVLRDPDAIKQHLGYLPQEFGVYPNISATDLLNHLAVLKGISDKHERKEQVRSVLARTNLYEQRKKPVHTYSGGMRQRFGIAQALLGNPRIIIVDEPTAGLDPEERNRFNNLLSEIGEQVIVILSTHLVEDVKNLCTRMAIINKGKLVAIGSPHEFIDQLSGAIWSRTIDKHSLPQYSEKFRIISTTLNAGKLNIHVHSSTDPGSGFTPREADLDDLYFTELLKAE